MKEPKSPSNPWATVTLGDLSEVKSGVGFPKKYQGQSSGDYPVYKVGDVSRAVTLGQGLLNSANHYVTTEEAGALKGVIFRTGSTLFAKIGEAVKLNRRAFVMRPGLADNNVMAVVPLLNESDRYLHYFLRTVDLSDVSRSTTVPSVRKGDIEDLIIPLPPLAEQKVIADKLDTLLAQVESTKARIERIPKILKRFRQSVLAAAVSGRLTEEWRGQFVKAYEFKPLGELVAEPLRNGKSVKDGDGTRVLRLSALKVSGIDFLASKSGNWDGIQVERYLVQSGDFLISRGNGSKDLVGRGGLIGLGAERIAYPDTMIRIRPLVRTISPEYLAMIWNSQVIRNQIESMARTTAGIWKISQGNLESLQLPLPSLEEQTEIVRRVDQLFAHADRIEQQVNNALARVNNLTQSILAKAFRGELTEQWRKDNPELISGENSAEALLERIKAERADTSKPKRRTIKT